MSHFLVLLADYNFCYCCKDRLYRIHLGRFENIYSLEEYLKFNLYGCLSMITICILLCKSENGMTLKVASHVKINEVLRVETLPIAADRGKIKSSTKKHSGQLSNFTIMCKFCLALGVFEIQIKTLAFSIKGLTRKLIKNYVDTRFTYV